MHPLAITGLGVVSPLGVGREAFTAALRDPEAARRTAIRSRSEELDPERFPDTRTAEVWGWDPSAHLGKKGHRNFDKLTKYMIVAAMHALRDAGLKKDGAHIALDPSEVGICSATAYGSLDAITELNRVAELEDPRYINPTRFPNTVINAAAGYVSIWEDLRAPNTTVVDGNCGALDAILTAETHLLHRRGKAFLVGGGEVVTEPLYLALRKLGALDEGSGEGLQMGEGACYAVTELPEDAAARGATPLAELAGYGTSFHPPSSEAVLVHCHAGAVARAIRGALEHAGMGPKDIDAVACSAGGLGPIDAAEREGIASVFGDDVAVAAPKRIYGETFGASGAFQIGSALSWMGGAPVAPLISGEAPERVRAVLVTAVGFYGNTSAAVVRQPSGTAGD